MSLPKPSKEAIEQVRSRIRDEDVRVQFTRSSGPGGQNINKVNTRATLLFDVDGCRGLTDGERRRIRSRLGSRLDRDGFVRVTSVRHRTQAGNRRAAFARLCELLAAALMRPKPRRPTKVPPAARRRRLREKRIRAERKEGRSKVSRSENDA